MAAAAPPGGSPAGASVGQGTPGSAGGVPPPPLPP